MDVQTDIIWILTAFTLVFIVCFVGMTWLAAAVITRLISKIGGSSAPASSRSFPILERNTRPGSILERADLSPSSSEIGDQGQYLVYADPDSGIVIKIPSR